MAEAAREGMRLPSDPIVNAIAAEIFWVCW